MADCQQLTQSSQLLTVSVLAFFLRSLIAHIQTQSLKQTHQIHQNKQYHKTFSWVMDGSGHPYANHRFLSSSVTHYIGLQIRLFDWGTILVIHSTVSVLSETTDMIKNKTKYSYKHKLRGQTLVNKTEAIGTIRIRACF